MKNGNARLVIEALWGYDETMKHEAAVQRVVEEFDLSFDEVQELRRSYKTLKDNT